MSISHILNKIKSSGQIDQTTLIYLAIVVLVGISSFGLGRLSVQNRGQNTNVNLQTEDIKDAHEVTENNNYIQEYKSPTLNVSRQSSPSVTKTAKGNYVASKNGKMYYTATCGGVKRIKEENRIWFESASDAEKAGYKLSVTCKK